MNESKEVISMNYEKIITISLIFICMLSLAIAAGPTNKINMTENKGTGQEIATTTAIQNKGEATQTQTKEQVQEQLGEIKATMEQKKQQLNTEGTEKKSDGTKNQNHVRIAAQTLAHLANMTGSRGEQISAIAKEFDNSIQSTIKAEEKIRSKSGFAKFFTGGDHETAKELENEVVKNQERIKELKQLKESCECDEEVKEMMQEQIAQMEQEQTRLSQVAEKETKKKGLFGWLRK